MDGETADEKCARERKEEIKRIKEAEEDALARALGLPVAVRDNGQGTGANGISVGEVNKVIKETEEGDDEINEVGKGGGFGDYVGKVEVDVNTKMQAEQQEGGLVGRSKWMPRKHGDVQADERKLARRKYRSRSRSRERTRRHRHRSRSRDRQRRRSRSREDRRHRYSHHDDSFRRGRSRSPAAGSRKVRNRSQSRSVDHYEPRRQARDHRRDSDRQPSEGELDDRNRRRDSRFESRSSRSPGDSRGNRDWDGKRRLPQRNLDGW